MCRVLERSLFMNDRAKFSQMRERADGFNKNYNGNTIIRDGIFRVMKNYCLQNDMPLELLRYPAGDKHLCACTFVRGGRIFVFLNSELPLSKQIFAAAHELYHIWCYLEEEDPEFEQSGSMLDLATIDEADANLEEMEANAFAGLLLVPSDTLWQQINIYKIETQNITVSDVLLLVEIFATTFKAMVLRLHEENMVSLEQTRSLLHVSEDEVNSQVERSGLGEYWNSVPDGLESFGYLREYMESNRQNGYLSEERYLSDTERLREIQELYHMD